MTRKNETTAERDERVRKVEEDRADRREHAPYTGTRTLHDVIRHVVTHGPARNDAERDELLGVIDHDDPAVTDERDENEEEA
jgi:hypothetical protein